MGDIQDKISKAKAAGYSDAEIAAHLADSPDLGGKIKAAAAAGYRPEEIISHLAGSDSTRVAAMASTGAAIADGVKGLAAGAGAGFGKFVLGVQRLAGKGLVAAGDATGGSPTLSDLVTGRKPTSTLSRVGKWLVDDADAGKAKLEAENAPYKAASPIANGAGEMGGSIVATLPVGGLLPNALPSTLTT